MKNKEDKMPDNLTYSMRAVCGNCRNDWIVEIPKGRTIESFVMGLLCPNCQCGNISISPIARYR